MSARSNQRIGRYVVVAAAAAVICAPLVALAYFATPDGAENLEASTVAAWAEPARELAGGLVTFASPERVYASYTQVLALLFPAILLTALATRAQRPVPRKRAERVGWRIALTGYSLFGAGVFLMALLLIRADASGPLVDLAFLAMMLPGMLISLIGSTVLGIVFVRSGHRPRTTAWLLTLAIPLWIVGSFVLGHNGMGIVPLFVAWAATGWRWRTADNARLATEPLTAG